jgi:hypothetical protein
VYDSENPQTKEPKIETKDREAAVIDMVWYAMRVDNVQR